MGIAHGLGVSVHHQFNETPDFRKTDKFNPNNQAWFPSKYALYRIVRNHQNGDIIL